VTRSHQTIPAAFAAVRIAVGQAVQLDSEQTGGSAGLPELLVRCVAGLHDRFPLFFATLLDEGRAGLAAEPRIGVTIDVGTGLFVPVFKDPAGDSLEQLAGQLMAFRVKALRGGFSGTDLDGANLTISLPVDDVVLTQPLVLPPQVCMLALGATHAEPGLDARGALVTRLVVNLGISYDHRLINGRDAALFLREIKTTLETPDRLRSALR
jgi:2-oxoglutarate dehydrogenase E2 component (dihydrolipoamide succinyltransferase)